MKSSKLSPKEDISNKSIRTSIPKVSLGSKRQPPKDITKTLSKPKTKTLL